MLTVSDDACEYLDSLLDHIKPRVPDEACFRLERRSGRPVLSLSQVTSDDESTDRDGRIVLVWDAEEIGADAPETLDVSEEDLEERLVLIEGDPAQEERVVELDADVRDLLANAG